MIIFLTQMIFPAIVAVAWYFLLHTINWKEFLVGLVAQCAVAVEESN